MSNRPLRIQWERIKEVYETDYYVLAIMSKRASSCILSLMHILEYEATFRSDDYDFSDWDELQAILSEADRELGDAMPLSEIIGYIDEVEQLLRDLQTTADCCGGDDITDGDQYTTPVFDGVGNVPQEIIDAGYATGVSDWAGFDDYKCMISYIAVDDLESKLRAFAPYVDTAGSIIGGIATIASIITAIWTGGLSVMALGIIAATGSVAFFYKLVTDGSILEGIADDIADNREDLACAIYGADGSSAAHDAFNDELDNVLDAGSAAVAKTMNLGPTLKALYTGRHDQQDIAAVLEEQGYEPGDFSCLCIPEAEPQAGCMTGLLHNCGFESALGAEWTEYTSGGGSLVRKTGGSAHDGTYGLGYTLTEKTIWFYQEFMADADYTNIDVEWWHKATTGLIILVDSSEVFNQSWSTGSSAWDSKNPNVNTTVSAGDIIQIRMRLHSTWAIDSINVVLS